MEVEIQILDLVVKNIMLLTNLAKLKPHHGVRIVKYLTNCCCNNNRIIIVY